MLRRATIFLANAITNILENGTVLKGIPHPKLPNQLLEGTVQLPDGRVFRGSFDGERGFPLPGSRLEDDGDLYVGEFNQQWEREGHGRAWLADGTSYEGRFEKDELVEGTVKIAQGTTEIVFEGTLRDETFVQGRLTSPDYVYEGDFHNNEPDGKGKLVFAAGATQAGVFRNGKLHGSDCKMKLEGGFVYVGEFIDGHIRYGKLFTPTYTYEGDFNEHGRAHGNGCQTYLTNDPKLIFNGIWENGVMTRGSVVDEFGTSVDWKDDHATQCNVLGDGDRALGKQCVAMNSYCGAKLQEAATMRQSMNTSYAEDATAVARETGTFPSKMDLRYEGGLREEQESSQRSAAQQMTEMEECRAKSTERVAQAEEVVNQTADVLGDVLNTNMAKINFARQIGAQELSAHRADEQLSRFLRSFKDRKPSVLDEGQEESETPLHIHGNPPWKSFTPPPRS